MPVFGVSKLMKDQMVLPGSVRESDWIPASRGYTRMRSGAYFACNSIDAVCQNCPGKLTWKGGNRDAHGIDSGFVS